MSVDVPSATIRYLIKGKLTERIKSTPPTGAVTDAFIARRLRAVVADIVVDSFSAIVKVDDSTSAEVKAALEKNVGTVVANDASVAVSYSKTGVGSYKIETVSPVIVAVALRQQPKQGALSGVAGSQDWKDWPADLTLKIKTGTH